MLKPIETVYRGYRMRSRLEARWAVFFDALGLEWEYEKEGFDLGNGLYYLPDFWLSTVRMWAEVKGQPMTEEEEWKCRQLAIQSGYSCLMLIGPPEVKPYWAWEPPVDDDDSDYTTNYALSNYHGYPQDEHRFYSSFWEDESSSNFRHLFDDVEAAVTAARSARFEHGERGS